MCLSAYLSLSMFYIYQYSNMQVQQEGWEDEDYEL